MFKLVSRIYNKISKLIILSRHRKIKFNNSKFNNKYRNLRIWLKILIFSKINKFQY